MDMYCLELNGGTSLFESTPALEITWHKTQRETYCHSARLIFESQFDELLVNVFIKTKTVKSPGTKDRQTYYSIYNAFLPCSKKEGVVYVNLNSTELVNALGLCEFTKNGNGKNNYLVRYPIAIGYKYAGVETCHPFLENMPPVLLCKKPIDDADFDNKIVTHLNLV